MHRSSPATYPAVVAEGLRQVERGHRVGDDLAGRDARALAQQADAQQALVGHRPLEQQAVVAEPVAMVGRVDDDGVVGQAEVAQRDA